MTRVRGQVGQLVEQGSTWPSGVRTRHARLGDHDAATPLSAERRQRDGNNRAIGASGGDGVAWRVEGCLARRGTAGGEHPNTSTRQASAPPVGAADAAVCHRPSERPGLHADLPRLRLPVPVHRRRRRALVPQPRRAPRRGGPRGDLPDAAPVGRAAPTSVPGVDVVAVGPRMALYTGGRRRIAAAARVRRRRALAPAAPRAPLRRRPHRRRSRTSRCWRRRSRGRCGALRARRRLARGLEPRLLARVPRPRRRARRLDASSARCVARAPARVLLLAAARASALRDEGLRGELDGARGRVRRARSSRRSRAPPSPLVVFAGRHIPEKRAPAVVAGGRAARASAIAGAARRRLRRRPRARRGARRDRAAGAAASSRRPGSSTPSEVERRAARARCACCCPRGREGYGLVVVEARARGTPCGRRARAPTTPPIELVEDGVNGVVAASGDRRGPRRRDRARARRRRGAARRDARAGSPRNARRLSLDSSLETRRSPSYRARARRLATVSSRGRAPR